MTNSLLRTDKEDLEEIYNRNVNAVYRVAYSFMKNPADTEDIVQETFLKLLQSKAAFESPQKERAWLIITASNLCRNSLKHWLRHSLDIDSCEAIPAEPPFEQTEVMEAIMALPVNYKTAVYLHYFEGYTAAEIASELHIPHATVRTRLSRAKKLLRIKLTGG